MNIREVVKNCLEESGIFTYNDEIRDDDLMNYDMDSLTFVNFIVTLEEHLGVCIPDDFLHIDVLQSLDGFVILLEQLVDEVSKNGC